MRPLQRPRAGEEGTVLVLSVIIVTLIVVLVTDASHIARIEWEAATNADYDLQLDYALRSGYQIAEAYLRNDLIEAGDVEHNLEEWALKSGITKELDPSTYVFSSSGTGDVPYPRIRILIEDEERKWPLPLLRIGNETEQEIRRDQLAVLIDRFRDGTNFDVDVTTAASLARRLVELAKREPGDSSFGATPRPSTKSGFPISPADLALIPEMSEEILFDVLDTGPRGDEFVVVKGLIHYITWFTELKVNVNTAPEAVLRALPKPENSSIGSDIFTAREKLTEEFASENPDQIRNSVRAGERREPERENPSPLTPGTAGEAGEQANAGYWATVEDLRNAGIATLRGRLFDDISPLITTQSKVFSIYVEAELEGVRKVRRWIVRRDAARFIPILSEPVEWPRFREISDDELDQSAYQDY